MKTETNVYFLERTIEVEYKIRIEKEADEYFAYVYDDLSQDTRKIKCWIEKDSTYNDEYFYAEECNTEQEYDAVIESFKAFFITNGVKYARKCTCCGKGMNSGYFADYEYFCSDSCLHTEYPPNTWSKFVEEDEDSYYWTEWEDKNDYEYVLFNNQLIEL